MRIVMHKPELMTMPPGYRREFAEVARKLALAGATDKEMTWHFEVPLATLHDWLALVPEFAQAIRYGRTLGDADVVDAFRQMATGCFPEVVTRPAGAKKELLTYIRHRPPNRHARNFWLMNHPTGAWSQKAGIEPNPSRGSMKQLTRSELQRLIPGLAAVQGSAADG
jgi:hypothetical protein